MGFLTNFYYYNKSLRNPNGFIGIMILLNLQLLPQVLWKLCKSTSNLNPFLRMTSPSTSNNHRCVNLISKCKTLENLKQIHGQFLTIGLSHHTFPLSKLLLLSSTVCLPYALSIFRRISNPSVFLYNTLIASIVSNHQSTQTHLAFSLYAQISRPNEFTYPSLLKASGFHPRWHRHGRALHAHVL